MRLAGILAAGLILGTAMAHGATTTGGMQCDDKAVSPSVYRPGPGDRVGAQSLELKRAFAGKGRLELSVCNGSVRLRQAKSPGELVLTVELGTKPEEGRSIADYIDKLEVGPGNAQIRLKFPSSLHAVVTLTAPITEADSEINLGKGDVDIDAEDTKGNRQVNLGYGHAKLLLDGDKDYSSMEINVGMGSLHDHRPGGHDAHMVISRNYSGTGSGSLEVNVGAGSVDIGQE